MVGLIEEHTTIERLGSTPRSRIIVRLRTCPEDAHIDCVHAAQVAFVHRAVQELEGGIGAHLIADKERALGALGARAQDARVLIGHRQGLLCEHVRACIERREDMLAVHSARGGYTNQITIVRGEERVEVRVSRRVREERGGVFGARALENRITNRDKLEARRERIDRLKVAASDAPESSERHAVFIASLHGFSKNAPESALRLPVCAPNAMNTSSRWCARDHRSPNDAPKS